MMRIRTTQNGIHFFDRNSGTNILLDEISVPESHWSLAPRFVSIALTNACDLSCPYCYAPKHNAQLSMQQVIQWATELDTLGCLGVGFGGGEPTLHPKFTSICQQLWQNTGLAVSFTTHGHHLTESVCRALTDNISFIRVSMDGLYGTYERLRKRPFAALIRTLQTLSGYARFGINYVVNHDTIDQLDAAYQLASELGAEEFLLLPEQATSRHEGVDLEIVEGVEDWLIRANGTVRIAVSEVSATAAMSIADPFPNAPACESYAHIDADGVLKSTSYSCFGVSLSGIALAHAFKCLRVSERALT